MLKKEIIYTNFKNNKCKEQEIFIFSANQIRLKPRLYKITKNILLKLDKASSFLMIKRFRKLSHILIHVCITHFIISFEIGVNKEKQVST